MSAPTTHDPRFVNTKDGVVWVRRAVVEGRGLYAVTDSCKCPEYLMATLAELAEHGIAGSADVLPMPVGSGARSVEAEQPAVYGPALPWAALAEVEKVCATWRLIAEAQHGHNTAPGPDAERPVNELTAAFMPVPSLREVLDGEHYTTVHHDYSKGRDMPQAGGAR
jgi:hypothetical protein